MNRLLIRNQIGFGIAGRQGGFTQHIVGVTKAFFFKLAGVGQGFGNGFTGHELFAHQAHRHIHAFPDERLAALANNSVERARQVDFIVR